MNTNTRIIISNIAHYYPQLTEQERETLTKLENSWLFQLRRFIKTQNIKFKSDLLIELETYLDDIEHINSLQIDLVSPVYSVMLDQLINIWDGQLRSTIEKGYE